MANMLLKNLVSLSNRISMNQARRMSSQKKLEGKVAVVTASTDGIGLAIARRLAQDGAKVVISSRKKPNVEKVTTTLKEEGLHVIGTVCHVGDKEQRSQLLKTVVSEFGGLDILISNAATNPTMHPTLDCPEKIWDKIMEINVKAPLMLSQEAVPLMEERGGGSIVYISSIVGVQPTKMLGPYSVSKTAVLGLTKVIAEECAPLNIRVNSISPGFIKTKFNEALRSNEDLNEMIMNTIPMRRYGRTEEIAGITSFLCSDDASYITGENYVVAGGMPSRL